MDDFNKLSIHQLALHIDALRDAYREAAIANPDDAAAMEWAASLLNTVSKRLTILYERRHY